MNISLEQFLMNLFVNEGVNKSINISSHLGYMRNTFKCSDKEIYYVLSKWSKKGIINYGVSINFPWLEADKNEK